MNNFPGFSEFVPRGCMYDNRDHGSMFKYSNYISQEAMLMESFFSEAPECLI